MAKSRRPVGVIVLILFHLFNTTIWFFGQTLAFIDYDMVAGWGLQEPRELLIACPISVAAIALTFQSSPWGHYLLTMVGFFYVWANTMTTATSLRFENPKLTLTWFIVFPMGIFVGLGILVWTALNAGLF